MNFLKHIGCPIEEWIEITPIVENSIQYAIGMLDKTLTFLSVATVNSLHQLEVTELEYEFDNSLREVLKKLLAVLKYRVDTISTFSLGVTC